jgi:hypothetical protein
VSAPRQVVAKRTAFLSLLLQPQKLWPKGVQSAPKAAFDFNYLRNINKLKKRKK